MDDIYMLLQEIKKRPALYLGKISLERLYAFLSGYMHCKGSCCWGCLEGFQEYVQKVYHMHTDHNWGNIIQFFSQSDGEAFDRFYELLETYVGKLNNESHL